MTEFVQGLLNLDAYVKQVAPGTQEPPVTITGVSIDTSTGNIWVRGIVNAMPVTNVQQAGVSPWAIAGLIAGIFAIIGAAVTLRYVYEVHEAVFGPPPPPGGLDPCTNPGIVNYIQCLARESKWFVAGFAVGVIALVVFLLVKFGPKEGIQ